MADCQNRPLYVRPIVRLSLFPLPALNTDAPSMFAIATGLAAAAFLGLMTWHFAKRSTSRLPLPPGPRPLPLIGNVLDIPRKKESLVYSQMAQRYGAYWLSWRWVKTELKVKQATLCILRCLDSMLSF